MIHDEEKKWDESARYDSMGYTHNRIPAKLTSPMHGYRVMPIPYINSYTASCYQFVSMSGSVRTAPDGIWIRRI